MFNNTFGITGLTKKQVATARKKHGTNTLTYKKENNFWTALTNLAKEPMVILLFVASCIYLISGKWGDSFFLASALVLECAISLYQDSRSRNALEKLKDITQPNCKVIRDGKIVAIKSEEIVLGDNLLTEEGALIAADGIIVHANDFSVNESILTGESLPVVKDTPSDQNAVFQGSMVASGLAIVRVTAIGNQTKLGKIGKSLEGIQEEKTPLELQITNFVKKMAFSGLIVFVIFWAINYYHSHNILDSLLKALTLAMSILPEEIPIAFTTFMAIGAWRLMNMGIVVKQMKTVETLGSATVICTDKTGTLTENKMSLAKVFALSTGRISESNVAFTEQEKEVLSLAVWASEVLPFDPMEIALHTAYSNFVEHDQRPAYSIIHEYTLTGKPPMMTHIFENESNHRIIAAKGAPEALIAASSLNEIQKQQIHEAINTLAVDGYRVLGVAEAVFTGSDFPENQQDLPFEFKGLVAFYDPPKHNIQAVLNDFYTAGISVKIITGDNTPTTTAIAKQIGFKGYENSITGDELIQLSDHELAKQVQQIQLFTRMFPDAKLRVINALKAQNEIVAMTGDGVNDGPALKAAHIGIAMGKKGTEIAKQAASLILVEDDLSKMVHAVGVGRRIYANLKKAIQYIISIHIPIILTVFIPLTLGWAYPNIFSPIHIIFLELIMGPTCSIIYENEPMEKNTMTQKPRPLTNTFFSWKELTTSMIQGLVITTGTLLVYLYAVSQNAGEEITRTMVFTVLIAANIFLTLVNRSFYYSIFTTLQYKNNLVWLIIGITASLAGITLLVKPVSDFFEFKQLSALQLGICVATGFVSVMWYELVKWVKRIL